MTNARIITLGTILIVTNLIIYLARHHFRRWTTWPSPAVIQLVDSRWVRVLSFTAAFLGLSAVSGIALVYAQTGPTVELIKDFGGSTTLETESGVEFTYAANPDGSLRIEIVTAYNFIVDSNVESPSTYAPEAAYIGAHACNNGTTDLTNTYAYIGNYIDGITDTPGIYPARTHSGLVGTFSLTHEGGTMGTADATRYIGDIPAGECVTQYWLVSYPRLDDNGNSVTGGIKPDDDLWLEYDIWATANDGVTPLLAEETRKVTMRNEISAAANKIWPNGDNKVPEEYKNAIAELLGWDTISPSGNAYAYPGETIITKGIWYDLGNVGQGFDNDGDLIPDQNAWMQPVGDPGLFLPGCFRLVGTYGIVVVKLKGGGEYLIPFRNQLYFEDIPDNTGAVGLVYYEYLALNGACEAFMTPYQEVASGFDNEKFNGDFGIYMPSLVSLEPLVEINKTVDQTIIGPSLPVDLQYTIDITNSGPITTGLPSLGLPLVISDSIPAGTTYIMGTAEMNNTLPTGVATYTIRYSTDNGATWETTEPAPAVGVTNIQWRLSDGMQPGTNGTVTFGVTVPSGYVGALIPNTGALSFGDATPFTEDDATTLIRGINSVGDTVWSDDGNGGGTVGDGTIDGGEGGISGVTVTLYYDVDGDGIVDGDDLLWGTDTTDGSGNYGYTDLPDGKFIVEVSTSDPGLPTGYIPSTDTSIPVDLDAAGSNSSPVDFLDADFGFSPVLALDKVLTSSSPVYEGETIQYTLTITNMLPAGSGPILDSAYWATDAISGTTFFNTPPTDYYANVIGAPDGIINSSYSGNGNDKWLPNPTLADMIKGTGYSVPQCGNITKVEALYYIDIDDLVGADDDQLRGKIYFGGADWQEFSVSNNDLETLYSGGITELAVDITSTNTGHGGDITDWSLWDNSPANEIQFGIGGDLINNTDNATLNVDAIGVRFTVDDPACTDVGNGYDPDTSVTPLPLTDTYDPTKLLFLSASVAADSTAPAGILSWDNLGPLNSGDTKIITVSFLALEPLTNSAEMITNTATINNAYTGSGLPTNDATDDASVMLMPTGSIGDRVWRDIDGMGDQDVGEDGIPNVIVNLTPPAGIDIGNGPGVAITTTTDADGYYLFDGLKFSGVYTVTVDTGSLPVGAGSATNTYDEDDGTISPNDSTLVALDHDATNGSDEHNTADFGYTLPTLIDGTIWHDRNQSGTGSPDSGEEWLAGVTVELYDSGGLVDSTTSDANGYFAFTGNYTGTYSVTITTGTGDMLVGTWSQSFDTDGTGTGNQASLSVASGGYGRVDFSYYQTGTLSIGDMVFYDWNRDGTQDAGDEGIAAVTISLYEDSNGDGVIDTGTDALVITTTTSITGFYSFTGLPAGDYIVDVDETDTDFPPQFVQTADPDEAGLCNTCDGMAEVPLTVVTDTIDFGYQPFGFGSIGDSVWHDVNGDGTQSGLLETGIGSITVELWADLNGDSIYTLILTTTTGTDGTYLFQDLPDGDYQVRVDATDPNLPTDPFGNAYIATTGTAVSTTINNGNTFLDADFGFTQLGAVGDTVYWDANGDGEQDWNESGVPGVVITLTNTTTITGTDNTVYAPGTFVITDTTDVDGKYLFTNLVPGDYDVIVDTSGPVSGTAQTADPDRDGVTCTDNTYPAMPACDDATNVTVNYGTSFVGADFGYQPKGAFGDYVWFDQDGDGVQDGGEIGIGSLVVTATASSDVTINGTNYPAGTTITTTTDYDGYYSFDGLISNGSDATWMVTVQTPANMSATYDPDGTADAGTTVVIDTNGDVTAVGGSGCANCELTVDFGFEMDGPYGLTGSVCLETSGSSNRVCGDGTDTAVTSYTVYLYNDDGDFLGSTTTGPTGIYTFTNLIDDVYYVSIGNNLPPLDTTSLTTTDSDTPATTITDTGSSVYQTVAVNAANAGSDGGADANIVENVDFAYLSTVNYDFGDLPSSYSTLLGDAPSGPRHTVPMTPTLYLGAVPPDSENDGVNSFLADGDGADEDGVTAVNPTAWVDGANGGTVSVDVTGSGWLVGWIDFNDDGDFTDTDEMIITQAVITGTYPITFDIPAGTIGGGNTDFYSRFRLFSEQPPIDSLAYTGPAEEGEVEDYLFSTIAPGTIGDYVWNDADGQGDQNEASTGMSGIRVYIDMNSNGIYDNGEPNDITDGNGAYDIIELPPGTYTVTVDADTIPVGYILTTGNDPFVENLTSGEDVDTADFGFMLQTAGVTKSVIADNLSATVLPDVAVGEIITYQVQISPTMGVFQNAVLTDTLDAGLAFVSCSSITASADLSTSIGGFATACNDPVNPTVAGSGTEVVFDFDTITNTNASTAVSEYITITYRAVVVNALTNNQGDARNNTAVFDWDSGSSSGSSSNVTLTEPFLDLTKTMTPTAVYPGNTITYTLSITHTGGGDQPAYDLVFTDTVPAGLTYVPASLTNVAGVAAVLDDTASPVLTATIGTLTPGQGSIIQFRATVNTLISAPRTVTNTGNLTWSSLPGSITTTQSPYNANATERTGRISDPGGSANDYTTADDAAINVDPLIDLDLTKNVNDATPGYGDTITYTISVVNYGPSKATGVTISDTLPAELTYVDNIASQGNYTTTTNVWTVGSLLLNQTETLTITAVVSGTGTISNIAEVETADQTDIDSTPGDSNAAHDDQDNADITVPPAIDLELTKDVNTGTPSYGDTITYTISVENKGPDTATTVTVSDTLPAELTYVTSSDTVNYDDATGIWTVGTLTMNQTKTLTITAVVSGTGTISNIAEVETADQTDIDSTPGDGNPAHDDQDDADITVPSIVDLELTKDVNTGTPSYGDTITYTISVENKGPDTATTVTVSDTLPAELTYVTSIASQGSYTTTTNLWTVGTLAMNQTEMLTITAVVSGTGTISNIAEVETADQTDIDSTPGDGNPAHDDQDDADITVPSIVDLELTKDVNTGTPSYGDTITYTISVENKGPDTATTVTVSDTLPAELTYVTSIASQGSYTTTTNLWTVGTLAMNQTEMLTITAVVDATGTISNIAEVETADQTDIDSTPGDGNAAHDDQDNADITVPSIVDLELMKDVNTATPNYGDTITYTITVENKGPDTATNVTVSDTLPAALTYVTSSDTVNYNDATGIWTVGTLAMNQTETLTITAVVDATGTISNIAEVETADQTDIDSTPGDGNAAHDDQDNADITVPTTIDLELMKDVNTATPNYGDTITYTITVENKGPDTATNVTVSDTLPAALTYVTSSDTVNYNDATGIWTVGTLTMNQTKTLTITAVVSGTGTISNIAEVETADQTDIDSTPGDGNPAHDDQDNADITVPSIVDLELTKDVNTGTPSYGDTITYTISVENKGPDTATTVTVSDTLPAELTYVTSSDTVNYDDATGIWTVGTLTMNQTKTLTITAVVNATGTITNIAEVETADQDDIDSTPGDGNAADDDQDNADITVPTTIDLELMKDVNTATPNYGDTITYTITVENKGPDTATNVTVSDTLPAALTYVTSSDTVNYDDATGIWTVGTLTMNQTKTLTITAVVNATGTITNIAEVETADQDDIDSTPGDGNAADDDQDNADITVPTTIDLELMKDVNTATPNYGDTITYTITVENKGPDTATNVTVSDTLPAALTYVTSSDTVNYNDATGIWTVGTLAMNQTEMLTITAVVSGTGTIGNIAEVETADQTDIDSTPGDGNPAHDDQDNADITVPSIVDLELTKDVNTGTPSYGDTITYTISVENKGPDTATTITVSDTLPAELTYVTSIASQGSYTTTTNLWTVGTLAMNQTETLTITAVVDATGTISNIAEVETADQTDIDSTPGDGNAAHDDQDNADITVPPAIDLELTKDVNTGTPSHGDTITYTISVENKGPDTATTVTVSDTLPAELTYVTSIASQGSYTTTTNLWTVGTLAMNQTEMLTITAVVSGTGTISNIAEVETADQTDIDSTPGDGNPAHDDQDDADITVPSIVDLELTKDVNTGTPSYGDTITYTISVENKGPDMATTVTVSDTLPAELTYVTSIASQGSYTTTTNLWTVGTLAMNQTEMLTITAVVSGTGTISNIAEVETADQTDIDSTPGDGNPAHDDQDNADITVPPAIDLELTKDVNTGTPSHGGTITYTISVENKGPDTATTVTVSDTLPAELTYVTSIASQGSYTTTTNLWTVGTLAMNQTEMLTITAVVSGTGTISNIAEVETADQTDIDSTPGDGNPAHDDQDDEVINVPPVVDLDVDKTASDTTPNIGDTLVFTVTVLNQGPDIATNVIVSEILPINVTHVSDAATSGIYDESTGLWTIGNIGILQTDTLVVTTTVSMNGTYTNTARVIKVDQEDLDNTNDDDSVPLTPPMRVGNRIWYDANDDGVQNPGEPGIANVFVELLNPFGAPVLNPDTGLPITATTDVNGFYTLEDVPVGTYYVNIPASNFDEVGDPLFGMISSSNTYTTEDSIDLNDSGINNPDPGASGIRSNLFTLDIDTEPTGEVDEDGNYPDTNSNLVIDFGFFELLTLGNFVWLDTDADGLIDAGEPGLANVLLNLLDGNGDPVLHPVTGLPITATTNGSGIYLFSYLYPGDYRVQVAPENFQPGGVLEGYWSSEGFIDPDNDDDLDDNGVDDDEPWIDGIISDPVTLNYDQEPANNEDTDDNDNTNLTVDFGFVATPTAIELTSFTATRLSGQDVEIRWVTESEIDNFGFRIYRSAANNFATATEIHFEPSAVPGGSGPGTSYSYIDTVPSYGLWYYWLEDVETGGTTQVHGPVSLNVTQFHTLFLSIVVAGN